MRFQEFEEVTSGLNGLCIAHAHKWHVTRDLFMTMTSRLSLLSRTSLFAKHVSSGA